MALILRGSLLSLSRAHQQQPSVRRVLRMSCGKCAPKPEPRKCIAFHPMHSLEDFEAYDAYDAQFEEVVSQRSRISADEVKDAIDQAQAICAKGGDHEGECAAMWDVADELYFAYARQQELDHEAVEAGENRVKWSIMNREYDL